MNQSAEDFYLVSRLGNGCIVSNVAVVITQNPDKIESRRVYSLTEMALIQRLCTYNS